MSKINTARKGDMDTTTVALGLIVMLILLGLVVGILVSRTNIVADFIGKKAIVLERKICDERLQKIGRTIDDMQPITGNNFHRTVTVCGFCIGTYQGKAAYYLFDEDADGVPDYCDKFPSKEATDKKGDRTVDHCKGKWAVRAGVGRCCVDGAGGRYC